MCTRTHAHMPLCFHLSCFPHITSNSVVCCSVSLLHLPLVMFELCAEFHGIFITLGPLSCKRCCPTLLRRSILQTRASKDHPFSGLTHCRAVSLVLPLSNSVSAFCSVDAALYLSLVFVTWISDWQIIAQRPDDVYKLILLCWFVRSWPFWRLCGDRVC